MNFFFVVSFAFSAILQISASPTKFTDNNVHVPLQGSFPDSSTRCGDVLQASSGTISYKSFVPVLPNERCVWTVRSPTTTRYQFYIEKLGRSSSVIISGISVNSSTIHTITPTSASTTAIYVNGTVVVITFYSTSTTNPGFTLRYYTDELGGNDGSTSREVVARSDVGHVKHPMGVSNYSNDDLSVFLFTPSNGIFDSVKKTEVTYIRDGLEGQSCIDYVQVFIFDINQSGSNKWKLLGNICGGVDSEVVSSNDLILMVFRSDYAVVSTGFHLYSKSI